MDTLASIGLHRQAAETIKNYNMLEHGDTVAVGVSGGADSVALLVFLHSISNSLALNLLVCHVNHRLRGAESDGDAEFVRNLATQLGVPFFLHEFDAQGESAAAGQGMEEYSRQVRYGFFEQCVGPAGRVCTAHTLSDAVETVVFNLVRGTGVKGLSGIPRVRGRIVRPLRDCTREQVEQYLGVAGQDYRTDSTNSSDIYSRNYIRHNLIPSMTRMNPALPAAVSRMMEQMADQWQMTVELAEQAEKKLSRGGHRLERRGFLELPAPVAALLLQRRLEGMNLSASARQLELMRQYARQGAGAVELAGGVYFCADEKSIEVVRQAPPEKPFCLAAMLPQKAGESAETTLVGRKRLKITLIERENNDFAEKFYNKDLKNLVDCAKIKERVFVHNPVEQDSIVLQQRTHSLISRYRTGSKGLNSSEISQMAVVRDEDGTIWAQRLGADQTREPAEQTRQAYYLEVLEE